MWTQLVQAYMLASWIPAQAQTTQIQVPATASIYNHNDVPQTVWIIPNKELIRLKREG